MEAHLCIPIGVVSDAPVRTQVNATIYALRARQFHGNNIVGCRNISNYMCLNFIFI